jgi:holo-[acyl-carrier protein] synthase
LDFAERTPRAPQIAAHAGEEAPGIGLDLLEISRLERALGRRPRLMDRLFTVAEREYALKRARPGQHLAARFCAKEAVAKALGVTAWSFLEVEVVRAEGPAEVRLSGACHVRAIQVGLSPYVSLTHTSTTAGAVCVLR